jgi:hypothetical protein
MTFEGYSEDEIRRWAWLRAIEWGAFPAYLSQVIAPLLFLLYPWYFVVLAVVVSSLAWCFVRYAFVSVRIANLACLFVVWAKWPAAVGSSLYLFLHRQRVAAVVALVWPLVAALTSPPSKVGIIELTFAKKIGLAPQDTEL